MRVGSIDILHAVFQSPINPRSRYIVGLDKMDTLDFMKTFNVGEVECKKATGVNMDGDESKFFLCYLEDCFDPPVAIVRAEDEGDACERFIDECEWAQVSDDDMDEDREDADNEETGYSYTGNGTRYDGELVKVWRVACLSIVPDTNM